LLDYEKLVEEQQEVISKLHALIQAPLIPELPKHFNLEEEE
jgi:hypothetical protein